MSNQRSHCLARAVALVVVPPLLAFSGGCSLESEPTPTESIPQPASTQWPPANTPVVLSQDGSQTVGLQVGDSRVSLALVQSGNIVPITTVNSRRATAWLAADSFTVQVEGDREATSVAALTVEDEPLLLSLEQSGRPLVTFGGTGNTLENGDLRVFHPALEFYDDPESFFASDLWGASPEQAAELSQHLESEFGTVPIVLLSARSYLDDRYGESSFTIETIDGVRPTEAETILITVFLENWLSGALGFFSQLEWFTYQVQFVQQ